MSKPTFDPSQPFASAKPEFDPNAPFTPMDQQQSDPSLLQKAGDYIQNKAVDFATDIAGPQRLGESIGENLPAKGAVIGGVLLPGAGVPLGAGVGQIVKRMIGIGTGAQPPSQGPLKEAVGPMVQAAGSGIMETAPIQNAIQGAAQNLGRRALGFTKGMLKRMPGGVDQANEVAQAMLDKGVIKTFSGTQGTLERAKDLAAVSGKSVGDALAKTGQSALDTNNVSSEIINQLAPTFQGGAYDAEEKAANEVVDTIMAHGKGPIDFESAQQLKTKLGELAKFNSQTDGMKAQMYRRAYGIVSDALENSVGATGSQSQPLSVVQPGLKTGDPHALFAYNDTFGPGGSERPLYNVFGDANHPAVKQVGWGSSVPKEVLDKVGIPVTGMQPNAAGKVPAGSLPSDVLPDYIKNKQLYGSSQRAIHALTDKASAEASNSILSLRGAAVAGGALATGNLAHAAEALGAVEAARRYGSSFGASSINAINKSPVAETVRRAALAKFIDKVTTR